MKLYQLSFKDALVHLGIRPGRPAPVDPMIQRRKKIQRDFERAVWEKYETLCDRAIHLHGLRLQVRKNPAAMTDDGAVIFAASMGELALVDYELDLMLYGSTEDQISVMGVRGHDSKTTISRAA